MTAPALTQAPSSSVDSRPSNGVTATRGAAIRLQNVDKRFEGFHAVRSLNLEIHDGELLVLLGPSGCGKTTTLNMLAGLEKPTGGQIFFGDTLVNESPPEERDIAMVFQSIALYPHLNVRENIGFGLKTQRVAKETIAQRVAEVSGILGIEQLLNRKIHQLSGGQRQRVAIAKALVRRPRLFLLDEPFSSLDAELRRQMRSELIRIHREVQTTMVFVTHDQEEAMAIADRIAVMNAGEIAQLGAPLDLYQAPRNLWVARFIGSHPINILEARVDLDAGRVDLLPAGRCATPLPASMAAQLRAQLNAPEVAVGVRPEHVQLQPAAGGNGDGLHGEVYTRQILGTDVLYEVTVNGMRDQLLRSVQPTSRLFDLGQPVAIGFEWSDAFVFDRASERALPLSAA
jgi:multiple sugar transport system ATP-binding protein